MPPLALDKNCLTCKGNPLLEYRKDDTAEVIKARLKEFEDQTRPLESHVSAKGILKSFEP